jgi:hypothetical protein
VEADLAARPLADEPVSAMREAVRADRPADDLGEPQGGPARGVLLEVVVPLDDLDVGRVAQQYINPGSLAILIVGDRKTIEQGLKATNIGPISVRTMTGQTVQ